MTKYQDDIDSTYDELREAGVLMTIVKETNTPNPDGSGELIFTASSEDSYGIFKYRNIIGAGDTTVNGTRFESTDKFIMLAAQPITQRPTSGDKITVANDGTYNIKNSNPMEPDGTPIYYFLHVGK